MSDRNYFHRAAIRKLGGIGEEAKYQCDVCGTYMNALKYIEQNGLCDKHRKLAVRY